MKRCPKCNRVFRNELLRFCRIDGTKLEATSATLSLDEAPTLRLSPGTVARRLGAISASHRAIRKSRG